MFFEFLQNVAGVVLYTLDFIFALVLNLVIVPLSFLYSVVTRTAPVGFKLVHVSTTYVVWWSHRYSEIRCNRVTGPLCAGNPRLVLVIFTVVAPVMILAAILKSLSTGDKSSAGSQSVSRGPGRR